MGGSPRKFNPVHVTTRTCVSSRNDAQFDRINVIYHEASGGKFVPCAVLFDVEPGVIGAVTLSRRSVSSSARETS